MHGQGAVGGVALGGIQQHLCGDLCVCVYWCGWWVKRGGRRVAINRCVRLRGERTERVGDVMVRKAVIHVVEHHLPFLGGVQLTHGVCGSGSGCLILMYTHKMLCVVVTTDLDLQELLDGHLQNTRKM